MFHPFISVFFLERVFAEITIFVDLPERIFKESENIVFRQYFSFMEKVQELEEIEIIVQFVKKNFIVLLAGEVRLSGLNLRPNLLVFVALVKVLEKIEDPPCALALRISQLSPNRAQGAKNRNEIESRLNPFPGESEHGPSSQPFNAMRRLNQ